MIKIISVWDIPVRLFHWSLATSILMLFITAQIGGNAMEWHKRIGYFVIGLILFRVVWGFVGSYHARFKNFVRAPATVIAYAKNLLKKDSAHYVGHNPMGGLSVVALIASVGFQTVTGLFSNDDILLEGPYASMVTKTFSDQMTKLHHLNSDLILILVGLHLSAIVFYAMFKKEQLIEAMLTGKKEMDASIGAHFEPEMPEKARPAWLSWSIIVVVGGLTYALVMRVFF
jgi:cytochrome b